MYKIILHEDLHGKCPVQDFLSFLNKQAANNKTKRIELGQIRKCMYRLQRLGTRAGENFVEHIKDDIWELRPGKNRILFLVGEHKKIILLHYFRKTTRKTPIREIERSERERDYWIQNHGGK